MSYFYFIFITSTPLFHHLHFVVVCEITYCNLVMKEEVSRAASFIASLFKGLPCSFNNCFEKCLIDVLIASYTGHWHADVPTKGNAFRCVTIFQSNIDDRILEAWESTSKHFELNFNLSSMLATLPKELSIWVDPCVVSYRIGDFGSIAELWLASPTKSSSVAKPSPRSRNNKNVPPVDSSLESDSDTSVSCTPESTPSCSPSPSHNQFRHYQQQMPVNDSHISGNQCSMEVKLRPRRLYDLPPPLQMEA